MKNLIIRMLAPLSITVMLLAGIGQAQYVPRVTNVKVPFDFTVQGKAFTAGEYTVVRTGPNRISLRDARFNMVATLLTIPVSANKITYQPKLDFYTGNAGHELLRVWFEDDDFGNEVPGAKSNQLITKRHPAGTVQANAGGSK